MESLDILVALDLAVLECQPGGWFQCADYLPKWSQRFGLTAGARIYETKLEETFPPLSGFMAEAQQAFLRNESTRLESEIWSQRDDDQAECSLHATAVVVGAQKYLLLGIAGATYDRQRQALQRMRDRNLAFEKLERRYEKVEKLNELKSDFLASVSHELRTPLNSILGFSDLLAQGRAGAMNKKQQEFVSHVKSAADHLLTLINDVLDLSKIEAGRAELQMERLSLRDALYEVLAELQVAATRKGIEMDVELGDSFVRADRVRLKQIVYNLVSNALKFTPKNGHVTITSAAVDGKVRLTVADTGKGILPKDQAVIFDKYYQGGSPTPIQQGSGLGLAIAKRLVELQGGAIWVESVPGEGSRFSFTVCESELEGLTATPSARSRRHAECEPRRLALVEDDAASRRFMEAMLAPPHEVKSYETGAEALAGLPQYAPDAILLDMSLPDMSGLDVLEQLRRLSAFVNTPVIVVSAHAMVGDAEEFLSAGVDAYFSKPVTDIGELLRTIQRLTASRHAAHLLD